MDTTEGSPGCNKAMSKNSKASHTENDRVAHDEKVSSHGKFSVPVDIRFPPATSLAITPYRRRRPAIYGDAMGSRLIWGT